jgi:SET domain-containing protein
MPQPTKTMDPKPYRVGRSFTGLGLFATMPIKKNTLIIEYVGPRIPTPEAHALERAGRNRYMFEINSRWTIDGSSRENIARYANHACRPNVESVLIRGKIFFKAIRRIQPGEEITYDYGRDYVDLFFKDACKCATCRAKPRAK